MKDIAVNTLILVCSAAIVATVFWWVWTKGNAEDDYKQLCLGGHTYWVLNFSYKTALAPKLNGDGTPVLCEVDHDGI